MNNSPVVQTPCSSSLEATKQTINNSMKVECKECGKFFSKKGIHTHIWRMHGAGRNHTGYLLGGEASARVTAKRLEERKRLYKKNPRICKNCETAIEYKKRKQQFCNNSCAATYNNIRRQKKLVAWHCLSCMKKHESPPHQVGKYCNCACQQEYLWKTITKPRIMNGEAGSASPAVFQFLIERDGYSCSQCHLVKWQGEYLRLDIDHIDGNNKNNFPDNLRFLCPNCHRQTETWGNRSSGNSIKRAKKLIEGL